MVFSIQGIESDICEVGNVVAEIIPWTLPTSQIAHVGTNGFLVTKKLFTKNGSAPIRTKSGDRIIKKKSLSPF